MGSILSFPVLCAANTGLYLHVTKSLHQGWTLRQRLDSVLVNGDDQLYLANKSIFDYHIQEGKKVGLEMTVGKAYHHKSYTNVNSTCVDCPIGGTAYQINFLNSGLFFGQHKVMSKVGATDYTEESARSGIVTVLNETLRGSLPGRQSELLKRWFQHHPRSEIEKDTYVFSRSGRHLRNLFLPINQGGMGVVPPLGWKFTVTLADQRYAQTINGRNTFFSMVGPQFRMIETADSVYPLASFNISREIDTTSARLPRRKMFIKPQFSQKEIRIPKVFGSINPTKPRETFKSLAEGQVAQSA